MLGPTSSSPKGEVFVPVVLSGFLWLSVFELMYTLGLIIGLALLLDGACVLSSLLLTSKSGDMMPVHFC